MPLFKEAARAVFLAYPLNIQYIVYVIIHFRGPYPLRHARVKQGIAMQCGKHVGKIYLVFICIENRVT